VDAHIPMQPVEEAMDKPESPFVVRGGAGPRPPQHFIQYRDVRPQTSEVSAIAAYVLNHLLRSRHSVSRFRKMGLLDIAWTDAQAQRHGKRFTFETSGKSAVFVCRPSIFRR
jgi:hypothetical protein